MICPSDPCMADSDDIPAPKWNGRVGSELSRRKCQVMPDNSSKSRNSLKLR